MSTSLLISDLHQNDNPRDADRWNLFPWVCKQIEKHRIDRVYGLGDYTDAKDCHPSTVVNQMADAVQSMTQMGAWVHFIPGNHDSIDVALPFFKFLGHMRHVSFSLEPSWIDDMLLLPHTKDWEADWKPELKHMNKARYILTHATFDGAIAENGQEMRGGLPPSIFKGYTGTVYSGDIHKPQVLTKKPHIEYVGAPYRVRFGDAFKPRCILLKDDKAIDLHYPGRGRELVEVRSIRDLEACTFAERSQVKVRVHLKRVDYPDWPALKQQVQDLAKERGWELFGPQLVAIKTKDIDVSLDETEIEHHDEDVVTAWAKRKKLPKTRLAKGLEYLRMAKQKGD